MTRWADVRAAADYLSSGDYLKSVLPYISGSWYFVDGDDGSDSNRTGKEPDRPLATLNSAYAKCISGRGDGIAIISRSVAAGSKSVSLDTAITWAKYGITVFGVNAGNGYFGRSRIVSDSTADLASMITVSGQNNRFMNLHLNNEGDANTCLRCVIVTGNRNRFDNCHLIGGSHATPGAVANCSSLDLRSSECVFNGCYFGTNSTTHTPATGVSAPITFSTTQQGQNFFNDCTVLSKSASNSAGGINLQGATVMNGWTVFKNCIFMNFSPTGGGVTSLTKVVVGDGQTDTGVLLHQCSEVGWAAWSTLASKVYVGCSAETAAGAGGIATAPAA